MRGGGGDTFTWFPTAPHNLSGMKDGTVSQGATLTGVTQMCHQSVFLKLKQRPNKSLFVSNNFCSRHCSLPGLRRVSRRFLTSAGSDWNETSRARPQNGGGLNLHGPPCLSVCLTVTLTPLCLQWFSPSMPWQLRGLIRLAANKNLISQHILRRSGFSLKKRKKGWGKIVKIHNKEK